MPLTHLSYCYLNAVRWILGRPTTVSTMANRMRNTALGHVAEETCGALIGFENGAFASATASYIGPDRACPTHSRDSSARREESCPIPTARPERIQLPFFTRGRSEIRAIANEPSPFVRQAAAFLDAIEDRREARNTPEDALLDVKIAEAVSVSARECRTVWLKRVASQETLLR